MPVSSCLLGFDVFSRERAKTIASDHFQVAMQVQVKSRQILRLVSRVVCSRILYAISHPVQIR
jgi:hypothetical protein